MEKYELTYSEGSCPKTLNYQTEGSNTNPIRLDFKEGASVKAFVSEDGEQIVIHSYRTQEFNSDRSAVLSLSKISETKTLSIDKSELNIVYNELNKDFLIRGGWASTARMNFLPYHRSGERYRCEYHKVENFSF